MAIITQVPATCVQTVSGNSPETAYFPEAASQSFKAGQFVYLNSGKVTVCADEAVSILGMAACDATGTTDTEIPVILANRDNNFEANVYHSTASSAVTAITQVGSKFGLKVDSNKCYVNIEDTTNLAFVVKRLSRRDVVGDRYGRVVFQVIDAASQQLHDQDTVQG